MKIGLLDAHNKDYGEVADLCTPSKIKYCQQHGYHFVEHLFGKLDRTPHWGRILAMQTHLPNFDWLLYLDTDTIITNFEIKIESSIDENYDVMMGLMPAFRDGRPKHLSTSAMLVRNCRWVLEYLLPKWYAQTQFVDKPYLPESGSRGAILFGGGGKWYEQSAYQFLYDTDDECYKRTKIMPNHWCNHREVNHKSDSFLIHITGNEHGLPDKMRRIRKALGKRVMFM